MFVRKNIFYKGNYWGGGELNIPFANVLLGNFQCFVKRFTKFVGCHSNEHLLQLCFIIT